jgi:putative ABC transport system substrate-binding protein
VTGYSIVQTEVNAKRLALLREWLPAVRRVGVLENSSNPYHHATRQELEEACRLLGVEPIFVEVAANRELTNAVADVARRGGQALLVGSDSLFYDNQIEIMRAALKHALPTATSRVYIRQTGALFAYDPIETEEVERGATFIDRILRGANPADLPVEQPTRFELTINLKTSKALGIGVPPSLLSRAHEVIE